jgi:hypothetical protein
MTASKQTLRKRKNPSGDRSPKMPPELVDDLEAVFRGTQTDAWAVLLPGPDYSVEIRDRWQAWKAAHGLPAEAPLPPEIARWLAEPVEE